MKIRTMLIATLGLAACGSSGSGLSDANTGGIDAPVVVDADIVVPPPMASLFFDNRSQFYEGQSLGYVTSVGVIVQAGGGGGGSATTASSLLAGEPNTTSLFNGLGNVVTAANATSYWAAYDPKGGIVISQSTDGVNYDEGTFAYKNYFESNQAVYNPVTDRFYIFGNSQNESSNPALVLATGAGEYTTLQDNLLASGPTGQNYNGFYVPALQSLVAYASNEGAYVMNSTGTWGEYIEFVPPTGYLGPQQITYFPASNVYVAAVYSEFAGDPRLAQSANLKDWTLVDTGPGDWTAPLYLPETGQLVAGYQDPAFNPCDGHGALRATTDLTTWTDLADNGYFDDATKMFIDGDYSIGDIRNMYWIPKLEVESNGGLLLINLGSCF